MTKNKSLQNEKFPRERSPDTQEELPFSDDEHRKEDIGADWGNLLTLEEPADSQWQ